MKQYKSKEGTRKFGWLGFPCSFTTWGSKWEFPNGAFISHVGSNAINDTPEFSHGVQPNADKTAPVGWKPTEFPGTFEKMDIWSDGVIVDPEIVSVITVCCLDAPNGTKNYEVEEPSIITFNSNNDGSPNFADGWLQSLKGFESKYELADNSATI